MNIYQDICDCALKDGSSFISGTGGGGKTTFLINCASYLRSLGKKILITTTTKLRSPYEMSYGVDFVFGSTQEVLDFNPQGPCTVFFAIGDKTCQKWTSSDFEVFDVLKQRYDVIINEADGSRGAPLKIHTQRDPNIPPQNDYTVCIMGLWGIGENACEVAFGEERSILVDEDYLNWYLDNEEGLLKRTQSGQRAIIFNGADKANYDVVRNLKYPSDVKVFVASLREGKEYDF